MCLSNKHIFLLSEYWWSAIYLSYLTDIALLADSIAEASWKGARELHLLLNNRFYSEFRAVYEVYSFDDETFKLLFLIVFGYTIVASFYLFCLILICRGMVMSSSFLGAFEKSMVVLLDRSTPSIWIFGKPPPFSLENYL